MSYLHLLTAKIYEHKHNNHKRNQEVGGGAFNTVETSFFLHFELQQGYRMAPHIYLEKVFLAH